MQGFSYIDALAVILNVLALNGTITGSSPKGTLASSYLPLTTNADPKSSESKPVGTLPSVA